MRYIAMLSLLFLAAGLAGCGSSGSSSGGGRPLGVFVTDSFSDDYDHVWTSIYQVEVVGSSGAPQTVFADPTGLSVDLKTLRDGSGSRFLFLATALVGSDTHTRVRVTVGSPFVLFPTGSTDGQIVPVSDGIQRDGQGRPVLEFALTNLRNLATGTDDLVIDFDLANFTVADGKVTPVCKEGEHSGLSDPSRHESEEYSGTVSALSGTAPNYTFTLTVGAGVALKVVTNANTEIESDGATSATLANGQRVEVEGTFDVSGDRLIAEEIEGDENDLPEVEGPASAVNTGAGTFVVSAGEAEDLVPMHMTVNVVTTTATEFHADSGSALTATDFFAALPTAEGVEVEGSYDALTNTLIAVRVELDN